MDCYFISYLDIYLNGLNSAGIMLNQEHYKIWTHTALLVFMFTQGLMDEE